MTNREKYAEQIIDMAINNTAIAVDKKGKLCGCNGIHCSYCMWNNYDKCREKRKEWAEQEYVEPAVDWAKVPVDTKILVRDSEDEPWTKRYFAKYEKNAIYAWRNGRTSYSSQGRNDVTGWMYTKLAEEDI